MGISTASVKMPGMENKLRPVWDRKKKELGLTHFPLLRRASYQPLFLNARKQKLAILFAMSTIATPHTKGDQDGWPRVLPQRIHEG